MSDDKKIVYGLRDQLEKYFERQAEKLLVESRAAASLTTHDTLFGLAGEASVRTLLSELLPGRYGIGTGHIVSYNENSAQVDVVIYDSQECFKIPITETEALYSVEGVYAAIEIKTSPSRNSSCINILKDAISNIRSIKSIVNPVFTHMAGGPAFTRIYDGKILSARKTIQVNTPVCSIFILGSRDSFQNVVKHFRGINDSSREGKRRSVPDLLCVIDENNFGLCGYEYKTVISDGKQPKTIRLFWEEPCETPGEVLAKYLYWMMHKVLLDHFAEQPVVDNKSVKGIWPSVLAPVIPRIKVDVSESGTQRSFPWNNDTRNFDDPSAT